MKKSNLFKYYIMLVVFAIFITAETFASMIVVTTISDEASDSAYGSSTGAGVSLREAIMQAENNPGDDDIFLDSGSTYTLTISGRDEDSNLTGDIDISDSSGTVTIHGNNAIVQAGTNNSNGIDRMFHIVSGTVYINRLTLRYGFVTGSTWSESGGAIHNLGTTTMKNCTFHENSAEYAAGAISNRGGTLNLIQCTIYNNTANAGGGAYNGSGCTLNITNCTISGNYTTSGTGYGFLYNDGDVNFMNTTLYNNCEFSSIYRRNGTITITNSLIEGATSSSANSGAINSGGYNIIGYIKSGTFNQTTGDIIGIEGTPADIGINTTLTNNGGPTDTHALLIGSNGRDAGTSSGAPLRDQRGYLRSSTDMGAFEYNGVASSAPTDINLSNNSVSDDSSSGTTVGTLSATDSDSGETYSFALVPGTGSTDNNRFYIDGNLLKTKEAFDYEIQTSYSIRLWVDDGIYTYEKQMTISVTDDVPTDIALDASAITENCATNTIIGNFSTSDNDASHTYTLISGTGDTDNSSFTISANQLKSNAIFDYETQSSYSIRVRITDNSGQTYDEIFTITIIDQIEKLFILHPSSTQNQTQPVSIPLTLNNMTSADILSIELEIGYDPNVLTATGISLTGTVLENHDYLYVFNTDITGTIYAAIISSSEVYTGTGLLLNLDFTVLGTAGETSDITIVASRFNNNPTSSTDCIFTVASKAPPAFANILPQTGTEDTPHSFSITVTDTESNPCDLTLTFESSDESILSASSVSYTCMAGEFFISFTPSSNQTGNVSLTITATDASSLASSTAVDLTITNVNDAPAISFISDQTTDEDMAITVTFTATDLESSPCDFEITLTSSNQSLFVDSNLSYTCYANTYSISLTPEVNQTGLATISIMIADSEGLTASTSFDITVTEVNDAPKIGMITDQTTLEDTAISGISLTPTDQEDAPCSFNITATTTDLALIPNENITFTCNDGTYQFTITPVENQNGVVTVIITLTDSQGLTASTQFDLTITAVNDAPVLVNPIPNRIATEGTAYAYTIPSNTFVDVDSGDILTYTATQSNGSALPEWLSFDPSTRLFSGLPTNSDVGSVTITITATDGFAQSITDTFVLSVNNTNSAPVLDYPIADQTTDEDVPYSFTFEADTFSDDDIAFGDTLSYTAMMADGSPLPNWLTFDINNRHFSGTPTNDDAIVYTITVIASDTLNLTAEDSFYLTVVNINDAPEISPISDAQMDEDTTISINFSISDTESDASTLTLSINSSNQTLVAPENISISGTGTNRTILITPADSEYGIVDITVLVSDGDLTSTTSFALTVTQINDAPVFEARSMIFIGNGEYHNYAIDNSGAVWGWGNNASNQITSETTLNQSYPIKISDLDNVISLAGGLEHSLALKSDGTVWAWGTNAEGQLGDGTNSDKATPVQVLNLSNIIEIAANQNRSMALESDGTVWAWGNNTGGRLGDGTTTDRNAPVELTSLTNIVQISIGFNHNLALKNDNTVWAWGKNANGELGDGTITDRSSPVEITAISNVIMVSAGRYFSIALLNDFTVMAWGKNQAGQLGDASNLDRLTPVQVSGLTNVTFITAFSNFSHALKSDGSVWGWGNNTDGRLGDDSAANKNSPVQVLGLNDLMMISHGTNHSLALSYDGTVRAWGTNDHGQLGDRTTLEKHIPTLVPIDVYAISIEEDTSHTITEIITDVESSPCDLSLTFVSSDPVLFTNTNLTDTCNADTYTINITPTANMDGIATLTIIATDADGLTSAKSLTVTVTPVNDSPVITSDVTFTMNENATSILTLTATDAESADCSMDITFTSSNTNLLPVENISCNCALGVYQITIMPESNQSGNTTLTITITDSGNLTATQSIALTVLNVNDPPHISTINPQIMNEGTSISLSLTATDTNGDSLSVTAISGDQSLIQDSDIVLSSDGNTYSLTITPTTYQAGSTDITISVDDGTDITHMTFSITVNEIHYMIAGHVSSYSDIAGSDLVGVTLTLSGTHSYSMVTGADGYYTFTTVRPGDYTLTASKSDDIHLEIMDAVKILRAGARLIRLTCMEQIAADAYDDGYCGAYDAAKVLGYLAGFNNCLNDSCIFWQFVPEYITNCETFPLIEFESTRRYTDLTGDVLGQDFIGIGCGNVSQ